MASSKISMNFRVTERTMQSAAIRPGMIKHRRGNRPKMPKCKMQYRDRDFPTDQMGRLIGFIQQTENESDFYPENK